MKFIENNTYTLQTDYYNTIKVVCTYVEDGFAYFISKGVASLTDNYKLQLKTNKLYKFHSVYMSWDSVENTLSEEIVEDVWSRRMGNGSDYYSDIGQD